jgi:DNA-binding PadR family transcriptional regulator
MGGAHIIEKMLAAGHGGGFGGGRGWGESHEWGGRRGGRGRSRLFGPGELRLVLLHLIAESPRHGYELIKAMEELTGGNYAPSPGVVYPTLSLMTDEGVAAEQAGEGSRRSFAATEAGRKELSERAEEVAGLLDRLKGVAESEPRSAPPIGRAVANLMAALRGRAMAGDFDKELTHQIAEVLDEAARRIERL